MRSQVWHSLTLALTLKLHALTHFALTLRTLPPTIARIMAVF